jgi:hypothetical protein
MRTFKDEGRRMKNQRERAHSLSGADNEIQSQYR